SAPVLGDVTRHLVVQLETGFGRLATNEGQTQRWIGRLDVGQEASRQATPQRVLEARKLVGRAVRGDHDLLPTVVERVEGVRELLLRALLVGEELDVIEDQRPDATEALTKVIHLMASERRDHLVHERFGGQTRDARQRAALMQSMGDRQQKMGLAEPRATVDEERVEASARLVDHGARAAPRHLVAPPYDEGLERTSRRRRRAALDGKRLGSPRRPSRRRLRLERPVHDESESCSGTRYAFDRLCECVQMVLPNPLEAEGARDLNGELPGLEAGR